MAESFMAMNSNYEWDDAAIVGAYERCVTRKLESLKKLEKEIKDEKERIRLKEAKKKEPEEGKIEEELPDIPMADVSQEKKDEWVPVPLPISSKSKETKSSTDSPKKTLAQKGDQLFHNSRQWKVGNHCKAIYSVDGKDYEAVIVKVDTKKKTCVVRYVGYEYEEEVRIDSLLPSEGRSAWQKQRQEDVTENRSWQHYHNSNHNRMDQEGTSFNRGWKASEYRQRGGGGHRECKCDTQMSSVSRGIPPPPPPFIMSHLPEDESDALSAMLMSWYMSGFHTGYYQGITKHKSNHCSLH